MAQSEVVLAYWKEHREQLRQSETQRSVLTNFLLIIVSALSALTVQQRFSLLTLPLSIFIVLLGCYGVAATAKYYERASYHLSQARALTSSLADLGALGPESPLDEARDAHAAQFPLLGRVRLHSLWTVLHAAIIVYGLSIVGISVGLSVAGP